MENISVLLQQELQCEVCGDALSFNDAIKLEDIESPVCGSLECQSVMDKKASMPAVLFEPFLRFQKKLLVERREKIAEEERYREKTQKREAEENARIVQSLIDNNPELKKSRLAVFTIPSGLTALAPLPAERIAKYREHLLEIIDIAFGMRQAPLEDFGSEYESHLKLLKVSGKLKAWPFLTQLSEKTCGQCKGGCCASGTEKAYLSSLTMRWYLDRHPEATRESVLADYMSRLSEVSVKGGCINQSVTGCVLPKEMRADICNGYYCKPLKKYHKHFRETEKAEKIITIQRAAPCFAPCTPSVSNDVVDVAVIDCAD